jgi:hypothetical protein
LGHLEVTKLLIKKKNLSFNPAFIYYVDYIYMRFVVEAHTIVLNTPAAPAHASATLPIHMIGLFSLDYSKYVYTFRYALPL